MRKEKSKKGRNTWPVTWHARILDAGDGTGDGMIELPNEMLDQLGWKVEESLEIQHRRIGELVVSRIANPDKK